MKYIIEIKPEYEDSFKGLIILGAKDSDYLVDTLMVDDLEVLNSDYINKHFSDLQDDAYNKGYAQCQDDYSDALKHAKDTAYKKGFEDGKGIREKGCDGCKYTNKELTCPCSECSNNFKNQWTAKQTDDEIKVGDEVETEDGKRFVVTTFGSGWDGDIAVGVCADGLGLGVDLKELRKTGRHFDIDKILKEMQS